MKRRTPPIQFETIRHETPEQITRRLGDTIDAGIHETIQRAYAPLQRQASDSAALVAIALFIGTAALLAQLFVGRH